MYIYTDISYKHVTCFSLNQNNKNLQLTKMEFFLPCVLVVLVLILGIVGVVGVAVASDMESHFNQW